MKVDVNKIVSHQNHPQRYEKLVSYYSDTADKNEKFIVSSGIRTRIFEYLVHHQRGLVASLIQFKYRKYFSDDLRLSWRTRMRNVSIPLQNHPRRYKK